MRERGYVFGSNVSLGLPFLFQLELHENFAVTVENANVLLRAGHIARLGADLVIDVGAEAIEVVLTILLGDVRPYLERFCVLEQNDSTGDRSAGLIQHSSFNGTDSWGDAWLILNTGLNLGK